MLPKEKQMDVLEAFDLTKSQRAAAQLVGVDHHTVARLVAGRSAGQSQAEQVCPPSVAEPFCDKISEWIERSGGRVRADVVHDKLAAMGYTGSPRTTRLVVAVMKETHRHDHHRIYKPWVTEPGMWLQYDFGAGPVVSGGQDGSVLRLAGLEPPAVRHQHAGLRDELLSPRGLRGTSPTNPVEILV